MASRPPRRREQTVEEETLDRVRRTETRVSKIMLHLGIDLVAEKPVFSKEPGEHGIVQLPSPNVTLREVLEAIPSAHKRSYIRLRVGNETIGRLDLT